MDDEKHSFDGGKLL